jgi:hypothetical protein
VPPKLEVLDPLEQGYIGAGDQPIRVAVTPGDGLGISNLRWTSDTGQSGPPQPVCADRCLNGFTGDIGPYPASAATEGRRKLTVSASSGALVTTTKIVNFIVDRTPPAAPSSFRVSFFNPADNGASASVIWDNGEDPILPDGSRGSGVDQSEARYRIDGGAYSSWQDVDQSNVAIAGASDGSVVDVEARSTDGVGNRSAVGSGRLTLHEQLEDPDVREVAIDSYVAEESTSRSVAAAWLTTQDRAAGLSGAVAGALPSGYAGVWFDNATRRIKVGVKDGADATPVGPVLAARGLSSDTDIVRTTYSQAQLEQAQPPIEDALADLTADGITQAARRPSINGLIITVAGGASQAQRARISQTASGAPVRVLVETSSQANLGAIATACSRVYCGRPLRGGVGIDRPGSGSSCTGGFLARSPAGTNYMLLAGHCIDHKSEDVRKQGWSSETPDAPGVTRAIGAPFARYYAGGAGDIGMVQLTGSFWRNDARPIVRVNRSSATTSDPSYDIRGVEQNPEGKRVCMTGRVSGTTCGKVLDTNREATVDHIVTKHLALTSMCSNEGDSGGPAYSRHLAFGIAVIKTTEGPCRTYLQGASQAEGLMDVKILTRR